jgi:hypothetical protein
MIVNVKLLWWWIVAAGLFAFIVWQARAATISGVLSVNSKVITNLVYVVPVPTTNYYITLPEGGYLLQPDGGKILLP